MKPFQFTYILIFWYACLREILTLELMEEKNKSLSLKDGDPLETAQENFVSKEKLEECFAHVINTIDNNEVAKGLRYCGLLCNTAWETFRQVLTTYRMSCLIVKIVLCMKNADFEKLCGYIKGQGQAKQLSDLYYAYQLFLVSCEGETHQSFSLGLSLINLQFIHLTQKIQTMIKNPTLLLEDCKRLMASKTYVTPLFKTEYLKGFSAMVDKPAVLFQALGIFWTWSDHSILKELLHMGKHTQALSLLDKFDRYLESFKSIPIGKFPLPILSSRMIPLDFNKQAHTILAVKYKNPYSKCTWQNISKLCNSLKDIFEITRNAMQLLGALDIHSVFTLIYWMIPTSVISLITSKITRSDYYSKLCKSDITEVAIYPKALFSADTSVKVGPLAFFMDIPVVPPQKLKPLKHFEKEPESLVSYLSRTEELPEIVQIFLSKLNDSQAQLAHVSFKRDELNTENKKKDADIEIALKKNEDLQNTISGLESEVERLQEKEKENEKVELELKVSMELLKDELSDLQSQIMIKTMQNQQLSQDNMSLTKRIRTLTEKQENDKTRIEEEKQMLAMESNLLKSKVSSLQTENSMLTENNQTLQNEIEVLRERNNDKITTHNSDLIAENETLSSVRISFQQQLEESRTQAQSYQQQMELLKTEKLNLTKSYNSLQQKLTKCEKDRDKLLKVACHTSTSAEHANISAQHANVSAQHANAAVALICQSRTQQRPNRSVSCSETTPRLDGNEADDSSSSVTSLSTTGTKSTENPTEETRYPQQEEDSVEDNKN